MMGFKAATQFSCIKFIKQTQKNLVLASPRNTARERGVKIGRILWNKNHNISFY